MYKIIKISGRAKRGELITPHGTIQTPVFMNVGTNAAIKGAVSSEDLIRIKCSVGLANAYHLHLRPGDEIIRGLGGLRRFMAFDRPILTDSGGYQVFSLAKLRRITEEGVYFSSHIDGRKVFMGPEESATIQLNLASTIAMAFDECAPFPSERSYIVESAARTTRWLVRSKKAHDILRGDEKTINKDQLLFGINQGGTYGDVRIAHARDIASLGLDGCAIGGLAVGESAEEMYHIIEEVVPYLPADKPTYLMGVGTPENILEAVERGVDFFDCVLPARNGRHGNAYTRSGRMNLLNQKYASDDAPIESSCGCPACSAHSRAYIRHLFKAGEMLAMRLCSLHNLYYYNNLMEEIRTALDEGRFVEYKKNTLERLTGSD